VARVHLFGIEIDPVRLDEAIGSVLAMARSGAPCRYVVTPNLDHSLELQKNAEFRAAYADAALTIADGWPVVFASRLFGTPLPERVTGSDLVPGVLAAASARDPLRVFLLGAGPGVAERAAVRIEATYPGARVCGVYSPPFGFERDPAENAKILALVAAAGPHVLVVGLGAPKQELWVHAHATRIAAPVALCVGASIDFLAGDKARAPRWAHRLGVEWVHRMATEPRRLAPRYAKNAIGLPWLLYREWRARPAGGAAT
jgi:N-acetylglucosaminyldiphosphoundecaprenol N-acetyl-beta-D-mannosaminyltransferase